MLAGINRERGLACTHETDSEKSVPLFEGDCGSWHNGRDTNNARLDERWRVEVVSSDLHYMILCLLVVALSWVVIHTIFAHIWAFTLSREYNLSPGLANNLIANSR